MILNIETSKSVCSVALSQKNNLITQKISYENNSHSKLLAVFIDEIFKEQNITPLSIAAFAVSEGPGSYTGLRIGVSTAKGMAYALKKPLIAIDTLQIMCVNLLKQKPEFNDAQFILCPMIDAKRMEVYSAFFNSNAEKISETSNFIIDEQSFLTALYQKKIVFFGDGAQKCKSKITHSNAIFVDDIFPTAENMIVLSNHKFEQKDFVDLAYFEPFYLKPFIATTPKNRLL